jgi:DNA polymerase-2
VTLDGVKPWDAREEQQLRYDYEHYLDRQLAPAVDSLLQLFETSVSVLVDRQIGLFS